MRLKKKLKINSISLDPIFFICGDPYYKINLSKIPNLSWFLIPALFTEIRPALFPSLKANFLCPCFCYNIPIIILFVVYPSISFYFHNSLAVLRPFFVFSYLTKLFWLIISFSRFLFLFFIFSRRWYFCPPIASVCWA